MTKIPDLRVLFVAAITSINAQFALGATPFVIVDIQIVLAIVPGRPTPDVKLDMKDHVVVERSDAGCWDGRHRSPDY